VVSLKQDRGQSNFIVYDLLPPHGCPQHINIMGKKRGVVPQHMLVLERCIVCKKKWTKAMMIDYREYTCIKCYNRRNNEENKSH
tara:strand:- start:734 stop:985 length:252 start_codon:yes stop_codon:yes gene_type:complete